MIEAAKKLENLETAEEIAHASFEAWNRALQTKDAAVVAELYTENATFLPTMQNIKTGRSGAESYFVHFLEKSPIGTIVEDTVQQMSDNVIIHSGLYSFEVGSDDGRINVPARFTFVLVHVGDSWMIDHHHSSEIPNK